MPNESQIKEIRGPTVAMRIVTPSEYVGAILALRIARRGVQKSMRFQEKQVAVRFLMPLADVVMGFYERLKSLTQGYGSFDDELIDHQSADMCRVDMLVNGECVDSLSILAHRAQSQYRACELVRRMQDLIPRQMYDVAIQAAIGGRIIARETVKAPRKNVAAKCYGGNITRKRKLLEKQKTGKKRMKQLGSVEIPPAAFLAMLTACGE